MSAGLASRTLRNSVLVVSARALAKVGVFVVVILMLRHLPAADFGRFSTMVVYATLAGIIADLGLQTVFVRDVSRDRGELDRYLGNLISLRLLLLVLALLVMAAALRLLSPALFPFTLGAFALLLTTSYSSLLRAVFYIRGRLSYEAIAILAEAAILLGLTLYAVRQGASWDTFLWVYSASYGFTCLFALAVVRLGWHERITPRFDWRFLRRLLAAGIPLALGFTLTTVYAQVDIVLLQLWRGFEMVGWYSTANKYVDAIAWIPQSTMGAVFPVLSLLSTGGGSRLKLAYEKSYKMLAVLGVPLSVGLAVTAAPLVRLTAPAYTPAIPALQILAVSVFFLFVNNAFVYTLTAMNRQNDFTRLALLTLAVNLGLNLVLIPLAGYLGAAVASTLTEVALFLGGWWMVSRHLQALPAVRAVLPVLISGGVMGAVLAVLRAAPLWALVPLGAGIYVGGLVLFGALDREEWAIVRAGLARRGPQTP
ncbi:MAG TPA: flippase [Candidatus Limnocylindrales bacterium]|nr:flippase [Candidatus Limnocylindrales bacterium]